VHIKSLHIIIIIIIIIILELCVYVTDSVLSDACVSHHHASLFHPQDHSHRICPSVVYRHTHIYTCALHNHIIVKHAVYSNIGAVGILSTCDFVGYNKATIINT